MSEEQVQKKELVEIPDAPFGEEDLSKIERTDYPYTGNQDDDQQPSSADRQRGTRTPADVVAWSRDQDAKNATGWAGMCLSFSRQAAGAPGGVHDAYDAWNNARYKHTAGTPPAGSFAFWSGGSQGYGHVVVSAGGGNCYSTDYPIHDQANYTSIARINAAWGNLRYVGLV